MKAAPRATGSWKKAAVGRKETRDCLLAQLAPIGELPTAVPTACPSPPQHTLTSLRAGARRHPALGPGGARARPVGGHNLRVPGAATLVSREERKAVRKSRSPARDNMEMTGGEIRLEVINTDPVEQVEEAQEETSFESATWYLDGQSATDSDSPRGNIHDV